MYIINTTSIGICYSTRKEQSQILILSALAKILKQYQHPTSSLSLLRQR